MVDLKAKPYYLSDEDILWVQSTIASMTPEEKVGQLFFQLTAGMDEAYLKELMEKYHLGGCRYNNMPGQYVQMQNRILQKYAKVPVIIACNTEQGGSGCCSDGSYIAGGIKIGATGNVQYAHDLGRLSNEEAASIGCNMAFAPVCDIHSNWQNTEIVARAFGSDADRVAQMSKAYLDGAHTIPGFACAAKHFPGNGEDFRDAHLSNNVNSMTEEAWMATFGKVYKTLIDADLDAIMGGHIMMPEYMRQVKPGITDDQMLPATLCPEIMTGLLRDKLGFNGMVVTDASHMVGMTNRMTRKEMLPASINAGCDMFLFFNDPEEDFATMLEAYNTGVISEERMTEALTRILGLKAHMGLHKKAERVPSAAPQLNTEAAQAAAAAISKDAMTLVKYKDEGVLPLTPDKYKRIMIVQVKGAAGPMDALVQMAMGGGAGKKTPAEELRDRLIEKGFDAFIYVS
ncbi:MAG: beta-hexosaminidase, partial [Clostridia bacterium]|nr:beta-hexosaminidase [Clostridia bacterium]